MSELVTSALEDGVLVVTLQRPEKKNALTRDMYEALNAAFGELDSNAKARVLLITGSGDSFTSGNDVLDFIQHPPTGDEDPVSRFLVAIMTAEKPVVAAVNGLAVGVGVTMLLHFDLVYAVPSASLQFPFVNLALVPEAASTKLLPEMIGHKKAAELFMLGQPFSASEAEQLGIINHVTEDAELMDVAMGAARALAKKPPEALRLTKRLMKTSGRTRAEAMQQEGEIFRSRLTSPEVVEALTAFMEKRPADFAKFE